MRKFILTLSLLFIGFAAEAQQCELLVCDLNGDGKYTTMLDYAVMIDAFMAPGDLNEVQLRKADLNGDGLITTSDWGIFLNVCPLGS
jgi:hypothetical protein